MFKNQYKVCNSCNTILLASTENFRIQRDGPYGLQATCKECMKVLDREYRQNNKGAIKERNRKYRTANKERIKAQRRTIKGMIDSFNCRSRYRFGDNYISDLTFKQFEEMMIFFNCSCAYSKQPLTDKNFSFDHIIGRTKGGIHHISNIVPCAKNVNNMKFTKDYAYWYCSTDFYSRSQLVNIMFWQEYALERWPIEE